MILELTRSGGIGGMNIKTAIDTTDLTATEAKELTVLIDGIKSERINDSIDRFSYVLKVIDNGNAKIYKFNENNNTDLVTYMKKSVKSKA